MRAIAPDAIVRGDWKVPSPLPRRSSRDPLTVITRSTLPSPSKSPDEIDPAELPSEVVRGFWNVPSPFPSNTYKVPKSDVTTKSNLLSALRSTRATNTGELKENGRAVAPWKVPSPLPRSSETVDEKLNAVMRSRFPSPFTSPIASETTVPLTAKLRAASKPDPSAAASSTETAPLLPVATSGSPSLLKSPVPIALRGNEPAGYSVRRWPDSRNETSCPLLIPDANVKQTADPQQTNLLYRFTANPLVRVHSPALAGDEWCRAPLNLLRYHRQRNCQALGVKPRGDLVAGGVFRFVSRRPSKETSSM